MKGAKCAVSGEVGRQAGCVVGFVAGLAIHAALTAAALTGACEYRKAY